MWIFLTFFSFAQSYSGKYFSGSGVGDAEEWLATLDIARAQFSPNPLFQDISWLYTPSWNGFVEGPTWSAWWTQNSYGTTLAAAPWQEEPLRSFTYNANELWFRWEGDGKRVGLDDPNPAPDGCLCDAATPNGAYYKQGDGNVPIHDWALEETLSAVIMQAEFLLVDRDAAQVAPFIPLFNRTLNLIESRRDKITGLLFAGTSSNLLAPSFGSWLHPNGTRTPSFLTGMCVSYVAALDRVIELDNLAGFPQLAAVHSAARALTLAALPQLLAPSGDYFVKWADPNGTLHGVLGQASHGYIEAVVNHDAVALNVAERVKPGLSEAIMARMLGDTVPVNPLGGPGLRPFGLVVTNAGGLDDMEAPDSSWLWSFGTWVNGGEWATCEARQMLAYYATGRQQLALQSQKILLGFANIFRMDSPLVKWGSVPYQPDEPINTVFDMWAIPAALLRGLWSPHYSFMTLTLEPSLPLNVSSIAQNFPLLWGGKRLYLSASGNFSQGMAAVTVNGEQLPHTRFTPTTLTIPWDSLSSADNFTIHLTFPQDAPPPPLDAVSAISPMKPSPISHLASLRALRGILPSDVLLWLDAHTLEETGTPNGSPVSQWKDLSGNNNTPVQPSLHAQPRFLSTGLNDNPAVVFDGNASFLEGVLNLPPTSTVFAVFMDWGTTNDCCTGIFYSSPGCNGLGTKMGPSPGTSVLMIDWSGSGDSGIDDIRGRQVVAAVVYNSSGAFSFADNCLQSSVISPVGAQGSTFMVGSRNHEQGRFFNGTVGEVIVYPRGLNSSELDTVYTYLKTKWPSAQPPLNCNPAPECSIPGPLVGLTSRVSCFVSAMRGEGRFPDARYELAHAILVGDSLGAWTSRCEGLTNGTISPLVNRASETAASSAYLATTNSLATGLEGVLNGYNGTQDAVKARIFSIWQSCS